jgi:hypothetical protein
MLPYRHIIELKLALAPVIAPMVVPSITTEAPVSVSVLSAMVPLTTAVTAAL